MQLKKMYVFEKQMDTADLHAMCTTHVTLQASHRSLFDIGLLALTNKVIISLMCHAVSKHFESQDHAFTSSI